MLPIEQLPLWSSEDDVSTRFVEPAPEWAVLPEGIDHLEMRESLTYRQLELFSEDDF